MRALAIDTSAGACSVALYKDGAVTGRLAEMARGHAESLMPMVVSVLDAAACAFAGLDFVAVTVGPGAFTGLRVGLAAARGMALAVGCRCFGVSTLESVAEAIDWPGTRGRPVLVALDSRLGDVYAQTFQGGRPVDAAAVLSPGEVGARFAARAVVLAGDGAPLLAPALCAADVVVELLASPGYPTAEGALAVAMRRWRAGERPLAPPAPVYLRSPAATPSAVVPATPLPAQGVPVAVVRCGNR